MLKKSIVITGSLLALSLFTISAFAATTNTGKTMVKTSSKATVMHTSAKGKKMIVPRQNMSLGTVSAVNGSSFTLTSKVMMHKTSTSATTPVTPVTITVNTSASTIFKKDGKAATLADLAAGQTVMVNGVKDANNTIANAISVNIKTIPISWPKKNKGTTTAKPVSQ